MQAESTVILMNTNCNVRGDVVIECIHVDKDLERDELMLRFMFNTAFVQSNIMILSTDEIDIAWRGKDQFPEDFKIEVRSANSLVIYTTGPQQFYEVSIVKIGSLTSHRIIITPFSLNS